MIESVVLDCDGVILESVEVKRQAFAKVVSEHGPEAESDILTFFGNNGGLGRHAVFEWFYTSFLGREITPDEQKDLCDRFAQYCYDAVMATPLVPGILDFLDRYHRVLPLYVASGTPHDELNQIFSDRKLNGYFKGVFGSPPAKTVLLSSIVKVSGFDPANVLMVGDSSTDMLAAENVGTLFYGRGERFADSKWPWGRDLRGLSDYAASIASRTVGNNTQK